MKLSKTSAIIIWTMMELPYCFPESVHESGTEQQQLLRGSSNEGAQEGIRQLQDPFSGLLAPQEAWLFSEPVVNALDPGFTSRNSGRNIVAKICHDTSHETGIKDSFGNRLQTPIYGYRLSGTGVGCTWPGATFQATRGNPKTVIWQNELPIGQGHLLTNKDGTKSVVDETLHWTYSLEGFEVYTLKNDGVPAVAHLHGAHSVSNFDGNPEFFFGGRGDRIQGPYYDKKQHTYENDQPAGLLWYHDHALGITRLNVYAGLAGFYVLRDEHDTGEPDNPLNLPAYPYEAAFAIQDRMFKENGELFYPAFEGDPAYADFITGEGATWDGDKPTALAEFFGNYMVVNGKIWPKMDVDRRMYRLRFLNGCDSRFLVLEFYKVTSQDAKDWSGGQKVEFDVIGSDQGLGPNKRVDRLIMATGSRYDILLDFSSFEVTDGIIMANLGGDEPFGGDVNPNANIFDFTDRIMAFDVVGPIPEEEPLPPDTEKMHNLGVQQLTPTLTRRLGLFEGKDEYGRLQPLLGTVDGENPGTRAWFEPITV